MNRGEFMRELEYLLQDIPEEDKRDALAYYQDYLEEAGDEKEAEAIREFGSPERVAAIIRADLGGSLDDGGEFTDNGYQDERFRDPRYQVARRQDLPEGQEKEGWQSAGEDESGGMKGEPGAGGYNQGMEGGGYYQRTEGEGNPREYGQSAEGRKRGFSRHGFLAKGSIGSLIVKGILVFLLLCMVSPLLLGIGGGAAGIVVSLLLLFVGVVLAAGALTVAAWIGAVALLVLGVVMLFTHTWSGVMVIGFGVLAFGMALLGTAVSLFLYGKLLPFCICGTVNWLSGMLHRGRGRKI